MDVSGEDLIRALVTLTGIKDPLMRNELDQIIGEAGHDPSELTLQELRSALMSYLESFNET